MFTEAITVNGPEQLGNIQVPQRASYIRVIMLELSRIASHLLWLGPFMADIGAQTPFFYIFRERELVYDLFEAATVSGGADPVWDVDTAFSREGLGQVRFDVGDGLSCVLQAPASGLPVRGGSGHAIQGLNAIAAWSRQGSSVLQVAYASRHLCGHISAFMAVAAIGETTSKHNARQQTSLS
ncbi:hypothetical protein V6N12_027834 [Hibiscus sabdariffa]|uniref:NADH-quinone oxidoreductase subunit D domain-containing protein n=1 Tax=Hibiscus sabdariffa TaxID=183260 RepID=A0ABR2F424_9ROSI